jgi:hypothetical protein
MSIFSSFWFAPSTIGLPVLVIPGRRAPYTAER